MPCESNCDLLSIHRNSVSRSCSNKHSLPIRAKSEYGTFSESWKIPSFSNEYLYLFHGCAHHLDALPEIIIADKPLYYLSSDFLLERQISGLSAPILPFSANGHFHE